MPKFTDFYIQPQNPEIFILRDTFTGRIGDYTQIRGQVVDGVRYCYWCNQKPLHKKNQKYCSPQCSNSMFAFMYPQKEAALQILLNRQDYLCNICGFDWFIFMEQVIGREKTKPSPLLTDLNVYNYVMMKRLKYKVPDDRRPEVDHVLAIVNGGHSLGVDNHQVICRSCHIQKTKDDITTLVKNRRKLKADSDDLH